jgi:hypothetical protein
MKLSMINILTENKRYIEGKLIYVKPLELGLGIKINHNVLSLINKIKENGWVVPISITSDGFIVDGEHRYKALMELGVDKIPAYVGKQMGSSGRLEQTYQGLPIGIKNLFEKKHKIPN